MILSSISFSFEFDLIISRVVDEIHETQYSTICDSETSIDLFAMSLVPVEAMGLGNM